MIASLKVKSRHLRVQAIAHGLTATTASKQPARDRGHDVAELCNSICDYAYDRGLPSSVLAVLVELLTSKTTLDQSNMTSLIKNLYPAERVSSHLVLLVVSCLGQGRRKPSAATQATLLQWLYNVYHVLEEPTILSQLYSVLFGLLNLFNIRYAKRSDIAVFATNDLKHCNMSSTRFGHPSPACQAIPGPIFVRSCPHLSTRI